MKQKVLRKMTITEDELRDRAISRRMTDRSIARELSVCSVTVMHWRQQFGIEQPPAEKKPAVYSRPRRKMYLSEAEIRDLYVGQGLSQQEIAARYNVTQATVSNWLRKYGIAAASPGGRISILLPNDEVRRLYVDEKQPMVSIAKHFGCGESTVRQNLIRIGAPIRDGREVGKMRSDQWNIANPERARNGYQRRGVAADHRLAAEAAIGRQLADREQVHHINFRKRDNRVENLAVLPSRSDHARAHKYMEYIGAYLCGLTDVRPEPLEFGAPVFWGGNYVTRIDLTIGVQPAPHRIPSGARSETVERIN